MPRAVGLECSMTCPFTDIPNVTTDRTIGSIHMIRTEYGLIPGLVALGLVQWVKVLHQLAQST